MTGRTEIRMQEIRRRTRRYRQRHEKRVLSSLTVFSLLLIACTGVLLQNVQAGGVSAVTEGYSSVLLREGVDTYIVVGLAAFVMGMAVTVICIQCRWKKSDRTGAAENKEEESR